MTEHKPTLVGYTSDRWEHVCPTIRIIAPAEQAGFRLIRGTDWENNALRVFPDRVKEADVVIIQRDFPNNYMEYEEIMALAHSNRKFVVYELDDLIPELPEEHPDYVHYLFSRQGIIRAILEADAVIGSTKTICDYVRQFNPNVWELPNCLVDQIWDRDDISQPCTEIDIERKEKTSL